MAKTTQLMSPIQRDDSGEQVLFSVPEHQSHHQRHQTITHSISHTGGNRDSIEGAPEAMINITSGEHNIISKTSLNNRIGK